MKVIVLKKVGLYMLYLLSFLFIIFLVAYMQNVIFNYKKQNLDYNISYFIISIILGIVIGSLLGMEKFIIELRKTGSWKINYPKIIILGLPMLFFSFVLIFYFKSLLPYSINILVINLYGNSIFLYLIFSITLGYTIISSFYKVDI